MAKFRKQAEIRIHPLEAPTRWNVVLDRGELERLKAAALAQDTTAGEIVRVLVRQYLKYLDKAAESRA